MTWELGLSAEATKELLALLVLFVLSAFFSGSETALTAVTKARVSAYVSERRRGAASLAALKSNTNRMLIAILIGNNLVNIAASAMATVIATDYYGHLGPGLAVGVLTIIILVFGEVTPKTFAARYPGPIALFVSPPLLLFTRLALPFIWILEKLTVFLQSLTKVEIEPTVTETELIHMAEHGTQEGTIEPDERRMIERIFAFENLRARDVMIPRHQVFLLEEERTIQEVLPEIVARGYGRIPLISVEEEAINRVIHLRDVLDEVVKGNLDKPLTEMTYDTPLYAPVNQPISELFTTLREHERQMVVVVDEYGSLEGICTLEDMLEELVGEIHDEQYRPERHARPIKEGELLVDGAEELRVVEQFLGVPVSGRPTDPVSLWILNHTEYIPAVGERFTIDRLDVIVESGSRRRIKEVRIMRPELMAPAPSTKGDKTAENSQEHAGSTEPDSGSGRA